MWNVNINASSTLFSKSGRITVCRNDSKNVFVGALEIAVFPAVISDLRCGCLCASKSYLYIDSSYEMCLANENSLTLEYQSHIEKHTLYPSLFHI